MQHVALNWNQVISYFDTMADVVREVPQHVLAQPPHIISSFTQEEKKSMPKVGFNFYWAILIRSSNRRLAAANPSLDPCTMRSVKNHLTWIQRQFFFYQTISFSYMLKYFQLQYLKRLQYTAKKMTGLSKVAKEANKGLKFLDTRYTQFTYMQKVISCLCSKFCFFLVVREEFWRQHTPLYVQKAEQMEKFGLS